MKAAGAKKGIWQSMTVDEDRIEEAEAYLFEAIRSQERGKGGDDLKLTCDMCNLGTLYVMRGMLKEAEPLLQKAVAIARKMKDISAIELSARLASLALLYNAQNKISEAEASLLEALRLAQECGDHPDIAAYKNELACLYLNHLDHRHLWESEKLLLEAIEMAERLLGAESPRTALYLANLGSICRAMGRTDKNAKGLFVRALEITQIAVGPSHAQVAMILHRIAGALEGDGELSTAEKYCHAAMEVADQSVDPFSPEMARYIRSYAEILSRRGHVKQAKECCARALYVLSQRVGTRHSETAFALIADAAVKIADNNLAKALRSLHRAVLLRLKLYGPAHDLTVCALARLYDLKTQVKSRESASSPQIPADVQNNIHQQHQQPQHQQPQHQQPQHQQQKQKQQKPQQKPQQKQKQKQNSKGKSKEPNIKCSCFNNGNEFENSEEESHWISVINDGRPNEALEAAINIKNRGNDLFRTGRDYQTALFLYAFAVRLTAATLRMPFTLPDLHNNNNNNSGKAKGSQASSLMNEVLKGKAREVYKVCMLNHVACALKLGEGRHRVIGPNGKRLNFYKVAIKGCDAVLGLFPQETKALYRRAKACCAMGDINTARNSLIQALQIEPNNSEIKNELEKMNAVVTFLRVESFQGASPKWIAEIPPAETDIAQSNPIRISLNTEHGCYLHSDIAASALLGRIAMSSLASLAQPTLSSLASLAQPSTTSPSPPPSTTTTTTTIQKADLCDCCGNICFKTLWCGGCRERKFCSKDCQRIDWKTHRSGCSTNRST